MNTAVQLPVQPPPAEESDLVFYKSPVEHIPINDNRPPFVRQVASCDPPVSKSFEPDHSLTASSGLKPDSDTTAPQTLEDPQPQADKIRDPEHRVDCPACNACMKDEQYRSHNAPTLTQTEQTISLFKPGRSMARCDNIFKRWLSICNQFF